MAILKRILDDDGFPITVLAERKGKRYTKYGQPYCMYMDCTKCKNASWYDSDYCNNQEIYFVDKGGVKTTSVYCGHYEI